MGVLHTLNRPLNIFLVKDIFQQLHHLGNIQLLDLRCDAFQSSCNGTKSVSAAFTFAGLVILDAVFQTLDFVVKLFDLLLFCSFSVRSFSSSGLGVYSIESPLCVFVFNLAGTE